MNNETIFNHISRFEGIVPHLYLDTNGHVTVGCGNLVPSVTACTALYMIDRANHVRATPDELADEYRAVHALEKGKRASYYKQACNLEMPLPEIRRLFNSRIVEFSGYLRNIYPGYDEFPGAVRLAILDLIFQLGPGNLKRNWPRLKAAVTARDWNEAARHAHRAASSTARNIATAELFHSATSRLG